MEFGRFPFNHSSHLFLVIDIDESKKKKTNWNIENGAAGEAFVAAGFATVVAIYIS